MAIPDIPQDNKEKDTPQDNKEKDKIPDIYKDAILTKMAPVIMKTKEGDKKEGDKKEGDKEGDKKLEGAKEGATKLEGDTADDVVEPFPLDANGNPIKTQMLDANGNPMTDSAGNPIYVGKDGHPIYVDSAGNPIAMNMVGQTTSISSAVKVDSQSKEHQLILEKEKVIEDLIRQYNVQQQQQQQQKQSNGSNGSNGSNDDEKDQNVAVDFFLKMVKTYFALVLKFGDTVANAVIRMTMPSQIADPIISNTPLNIADLVKTADRVNQVLANPEFKSELGNMFDNTSDAVNPQIKMLLNKMADIIMDVAGKTGSKLASTAALSLSAFPPFAVVFDIANLISVGVNAVSSGVNMVSTAANSGSKVLGAFNDAPSVDINKYMANTVDPSKKTMGLTGPNKTTPSSAANLQVSPSSAIPISPPGSPPGSPPSSPSSNKNNNKVVNNKVVNNKVVNNKVVVGGGLKEVGEQFITDIGFKPEFDKVSNIVRKIKNAHENIKNEFTPIFDGLVEKYTRNPSQRGGKKTRRAIHRINQTIKDYHQTNKVKKTKRKK